MSEKIVLIDGHSIMNRAYYGVPPLTNAKGLHTNAIYGFLNILFKILDVEKPAYLTVAFDRKEKTFRHEMYTAYKGTRKPMPEELHEQIPVIKDVLRAMQIQICEKPGLEADDILGTIAKKSEQEGMEVSLVSGDRDLLQIASEHIKIMIPKTKQGGTEVESYYASDVLAAYDVTPEQFIELKALMGDTADNIPGVPKVGEKTARELMKTYGSIDNIYAHLDEITKNAIRESLRENRDKADLSKILATIKTDADFDFSFSSAQIKDFYTKEAYALFKELELKKLLERFESGADTSGFNEKLKIVTDLQKAEEVLSLACRAGDVGFYIVTDASGLWMLGLSFADEAVYVLLREGFLTAAYLGEAIEKLHKSCTLTGFFLKAAYPYFENDDVSRCFDIQLAAYLCNPLKSDYEVEDVASEILTLDMPTYASVFGKRGGKALVPTQEEAAGYAGLSAYTAYAAKEHLTKKLTDLGMWKLFCEIEMPLSYVLYDMERIGIRADKEALNAYGETLAGRISELETLIRQAAGEDFNINSPKQLGVILFEKMQIPGGKKTKSGYSTAADVLEKLAPDYPFVKDILEYRALTKLKSTYADGLAAYIREDGKIHTNLNQTITATGRISSTEPNLQNIPMRTELGRMIRKVFVPENGNVFTDADYSQIELRILAHMSGDAQLIEAYRTDEDIHKITASKVFHTPLDKVTPLQRRNAKAVNFGIVYGISSFGLSQDLSISRKEAEGYIKEYFATYPGIKRFLDSTVEDAKKNGYVTTLYGRRRPVPELAASNFMQRQFGERIAMNSPIQGTAADIIKIAMLKVYRGLKDANLRSRLILQIHDELLIETVLEEQEQVAKILRDSMQSAADLAVTLAIDLHTGSDWYEAK
ncbi:MAG: DNA polymerase I [Lachnospiraceae bacterium]|nr:DNA polymerase I [Lachnospiraceae bacterium]